MTTKAITTFPTVGNAAYSSKNRSATDVRPGMLVSKKNQSKGGMTPDAGTATHDRQVPQDALGAAYRITVARTYTPTNANVQANGRVMPSAIGSSMNFRAGGQTYGSMG